MPPHTLTNFEIQKYYQNEPRFDVWDVCNKSRISTLILGLIGLLCTHQIIMLLILIVLELNTFQRKLKHFLVNQQF